MAETDYGKLYAKEGGLSERAGEITSLSKRLGRYARAYDPPKKKKKVSPSKLKIKTSTAASVARRIQTIRSLIPRIQRRYGRYVSRYARQYGARYDIAPAKIEPLV